MGSEPYLSVRVSDEGHRSRERFVVPTVPPHTLLSIVLLLPRVRPLILPLSRFIYFRYFRYWYWIIYDQWRTKEEDSEGTPRIVS